MTHEPSSVLGRYEERPVSAGEAETSQTFGQVILSGLSPRIVSAVTHELERHPVEPLQSSSEGVESTGEEQRRALSGWWRLHALSRRERVSLKGHPPAVMRKEVENPLQLRRAPDKPLGEGESEAHIESAMEALSLLSRHCTIDSKNAGGEKQEIFLERIDSTEVGGELPSSENQVLGG
jgi:hypothetical protein